MKKFLVLQSDFGLDDGAVAAMYGVAYFTAPEITIHDLTHGIEPYNIFQGSYRLFQALTYWPKGSVFVSVVDPGVGSQRKSIVAKTKSGHYVVTPDNGTLSHIAKYVGLDQVRQIDEAVNRLPHSQDSHTFHGRDVYVYNGALLAQDNAFFESLPIQLDLSELTYLDLGDPVVSEEGIQDTIDILDIRFGSLWTNIPLETLQANNIHQGDYLEIVIKEHGQERYREQVLFGRSFAAVAIGRPIAYVNSLIRLALGINQGNFALGYKIGTGNQWTIHIKKVKGA